VGGMGMRAVAYLLVAAGFVCVVAAVDLLAGGPWALLAAGVLLGACGLLLVPVPERPERAPESAPPVTPLGPPDAVPAGR
jgi:Flp pilus assembly protein TadB